MGLKLLHVCSVNSAKPTFRMSNLRSPRFKCQRCKFLGGCVMMTTNKWPLIMTWSKTAPKGTKRAKVASTTMMGQPHIMATPKKKWKWLIWQWNCGMHGFDELKCIWTWIDTDAMWQWLTNWMKWWTWCGSTLMQMQQRQMTLILAANLHGLNRNNKQGY